MRSAEHFVIQRRRPSEAGNCFVWGCVSLFCFAVLVAIAGFFVVRYQIEQVRENYTAAEPAILPEVEISDADLESLFARYDTFRAESDGDEEPEPLELTQNEVNALIQRHPDFDDLNGHVFVTIEEDEITGDVTFPLEGIPMFGGRHFNGTGTFDINLEDGRLTVYLEQASVKGEPLPEMFMTEMRNQNLSQDARNNPDFRDMLDKIDEILVEGGVLTITRK